jgi:hypothetical protein
LEEFLVMFTENKNELELYQKKYEEISSYYENLKKDTSNFLSEKKNIKKVTNEYLKTITNLKSSNQIQTKKILELENEIISTKEREQMNKVTNKFKEENIQIIERSSIIQAGDNWKTVFHIPKNFGDNINFKIDFLDRSDRPIFTKDGSLSTLKKKVEKYKELDWKNLFQVSFKLESSKIKKIKTSLFYEEQTIFSDISDVSVEPNQYSYCEINSPKQIVAGELLKASVFFFDQFENKIENERFLLKIRNLLQLNDEELKLDERNQFELLLKKSGKYQFFSSKDVKNSKLEVIANEMDLKESKYRINPNKRSFIGGEKINLEVEAFDKFQNKASFQDFEILFDERTTETSSTGIYNILLPKNMNGKQKIIAKKGNQKILITEIEISPSSPSYSNSTFILKTEREVVVGSEIVFAISLKDNEGAIWDPSSSQEKSIEQIFEENVKIKVKGSSGNTYQSVKRVSRGQWEIEMREYKVGKFEVSVWIEENQVCEEIIIDLFHSQPSVNKSRIFIDKYYVARVNEKQKLCIEMFDNYENRGKTKKIKFFFKN